MAAERRDPRIKRLCCIVEGEGEVAALPALCRKVLDHLEAWTWHVARDPIRQPRSSLVSEGKPNEGGLVRAVELARKRPADAVLVLCDSDDDCPAAWALRPSASFRSVCVMAVREYEAWLLASRLNSRLVGKRPIETIRDAKKRFAVHWPGYKPSVDQLAATRDVDVGRLRKLAPSFDKLVRSLERLVAEA